MSLWLFAVIWGISWAMIVLCGFLLRSLVGGVLISGIINGLTVAFVLRGKYQELGMKQMFIIVLGWTIAMFPAIGFLWLISMVD
jgi:hypothetical protein